MIRSRPSSPERRPRPPATGRLLLPALLLAGAAWLGAPVGAQAGPAAAEAAPGRARAILADPRYQTRLPQHEAPRDLAEGQSSPIFGGGSLPPVAAPVIGAGAELTRIVFIALAVAVVVLIVAWAVQTLVQRMAGPSAEGEAEAQGEEAGPERELDTPDIEDATRLAAEGRYGEAIHALLLAAIHHFAARAHVQVQPSRTSRELVRVLPLSGESRPKFNDLVMAVERTLFGGEAADAEDFQRSLERFRSLVRRPA